MDDVEGTGREEHLMSVCEHMKSSLYLTDVVVLRHEGDTVNCSGLEMTKTRKKFRGEQQYRPCGILFESVLVAKLDTDSQPW